MSLDPPAASDSSTKPASHPSSSSSSDTAPSSNGGVVWGRKARILKSVVNKIAHIATKSRLVQRAAEKVSSYPLLLTVEVKSLDGFLAVNMAPPPSDAIW